MQTKQANKPKKLTDIFQLLLCFDHDNRCFVYPALLDEQVKCFFRQQLYLRDAVFAFKCMTGGNPDYLRSKPVTSGQASGRVTRNKPFKL